MKTLLYSGTFSFYTDITFVDSNVNNITNTSNSTSDTIQPPTSTPTTTNTESTVQEWPKAGRTVIIYTKYKDTSTSK